MDVEDPLQGRIQTTLRKGALGAKDRVDKDKKDPINLVQSVAIYGIS